MDAEEFTRLVEELCHARGPRGTQRRLADQLGCHPRTIGRYKGGERTIPSRVADRVRAMWCEEVDDPEYARQVDEQRKEAGDY
jgi:hypothetical protein